MPYPLLSNTLLFATDGSTMEPTTPPINSDLSRTKLKQMSRWIRDELDLRVAREGPQTLRPDDVLTLHEMFIALRYAQNVTVSDLRSTGIHKAVWDISGVATRWPGKLCDDCDKIISIWTAKFGPFNELHPFLYGRGGRLEGIASAHEVTREALLKRWADQCPEKIHPKRSHKPGDLGFKAGMWWINPLFAHHAGIIGLEACEGGTTYDKHGAYALLLKDTGEIEASSEERFTYRCPQNDKGRFRLTSALPKSRDPVRVLRSHSINSVWGPKAGVRYEGLIKGWSIKQAKTADTAGEQWKKGDILFDVWFERNDPTPMEEVTRRPTATEVDDYTEYKRLRRMQRDGKRNRPSKSFSKTDLQPTMKAAPPIMPPQPLAATPKVLQTELPIKLRSDMLARLSFEKDPHVHLSTDQEVVSPKTVSSADPLSVTMGKSRTLAVPTWPIIQGRGHASFGDASEQNSPVGSNTSSANTEFGSTGVQNIRDVAPWIDYDVDLSMPPPSEDSRVIHKSSMSPSIKAGAEKDTNDTKSIKGVHYSAHDSSIDSPVSSDHHRHDAHHMRKKSGDIKGLASYLSPGGSKKDNRKSTFARSRKPMAKLFDGSDDAVDDYFGGAGTASIRAELPTSLDSTSSIYSPVPTRQLTPDSPTCMGRRNAINPANVPTPLYSPPIVHVARTSALPPDSLKVPFIETRPLRAPAALTPPLPRSLNKFISQPKMAIPLGTQAPIPFLERIPTKTKKTDPIEDSVAEANLRMMKEQLRGPDVKVAFKNPFDGSLATGRDVERNHSVGVAPDFVVAAPE
ncbi:hypothetical protein EJ02DRAFT_333637 [Clathrospora elynae]|uniref:YDG domain-containing protein n=1 Tax=Clathrospora elynae TaxID=706981 RepID=A0A6A5T4D3_9PLEO|nr:hypothetical protein EJ02DRAFT_333637 [Clathrospora elynae]